MSAFKKSAFPIAIILLLGLQFQCERARASDSTELRGIINAKSKLEIERQVEKSNQNHDLDRVRAKCEAQISLKLVPVACFDVLKRETSLGLITPDHAHRAFQSMEALCLRSASSARVISRVPDANLPPSCRRVLEERSEDLEYKGLTIDPVSVFRQRF
jgi:hypothetical protein